MAGNAETEPLAVAAAAIIPATNPAGSSGRTKSTSPENLNYDSTGSSNTPLNSHTFVTPAPSRANSMRSTSFLNNVAAHADYADDEIRRDGISSHADEDDDDDKMSELLERRRSKRLSARLPPSRRSSLYEAKKKVWWALPRWIRKPLWAWLDRISLVLSPEWLRTTLLVWAMWCSMSLGKCSGATGLRWF